MLPIFYFGASTLLPVFHFGTSTPLPVFYFGTSILLPVFWFVRTPASCFLICTNSCFLCSDWFELLLPVFWFSTTSPFLFLLGTKPLPFLYGTSTALPVFLLWYEYPASCFPWFLYSDKVRNPVAEFIDPVRELKPALKGGLKGVWVTPRCNPTLTPL